MKRGDLTPDLDEQYGGARMVARSVSLRWGKDNAGRVLTLPTLDSEDEAALQQLVADCEPATFGRGGKDIYDEYYRRAGKLDVEVSSHKMRRSSGTIAMDLMKFTIEDIANDLLLGVRPPLFRCTKVDLLTSTQVHDRFQSVRSWHRGYHRTVPRP